MSSSCFVLATLICSEAFDFTQCHCLRWSWHSLCAGSYPDAHWLRDISTRPTQWLSGERDKRVFSALNAAELKRLCKDAGVKMMGLKKHDMMQQLLSLPEHLRNVRKDTRKKTRPVDAETAPLVALFRQSFLRPEPDGPRLAAAIGHQNKEPFLRSFFQVSQEQGEDDNEFSFGSLHVWAVFRCGLMRKAGSKIAKASLDAMTFLEAENGSELIPTEIKSRVSKDTMVQARRLLETFVGAELHDDRKHHLMKTTSDNPLFKLLIHDKRNPSRRKKEALQLLNGAFVAGGNRCLLLAGSKKQLMNGILVAFQQDLFDACAAVVTFLCNKFFRSFCESQQTNCFRMSHCSGLWNASTVSMIIPFGQIK